MDGLIIAHRGFEEVAAKEAEELIGAETKKEESCAIFKCKDYKDICKLAYKSQSAIKVLQLLSEFQASQEFEETAASIKKALSEIDLSTYISENTTFRVSCTRKGEHNFTSQDILIEAGKQIKDKTNKDMDFDNPEVIFHIHIIGNKGFFGVDFAGIDLSKREYRIFAHPAALKGTIAYSLLRLSDYKKNHVLLDPFTKSGIIPIEAALYATKRPVNYFRKDSLAFRHIKPLENQDWDQFFSEMDKETNESQKTHIYGFDSSMPSITAAQKNSKLAGVNKTISFSRLDVEWIDTKFSEGEVDKIVMSPPEESKRIDQKLIEKLYKELFYQAKYVLSEKGNITCLLRNTELLKKSAESYGFSSIHERKVFLGKEEMKVLQMGKK